MEHYSRDKVFLRILNTLFFILLLFVNIKLCFFSGDKSFINRIDIKFFMSPYKYLYGLNFISLIYTTIFILIQIDSSSHGIKKKVVENYSFYIFLNFIFMIGHLLFLSQKKYAVSFFFIFLSLVLNILLYLKAQTMKRYMYNDEVRVFVYPFSISLSWVLIMFLMTLNLMFTHKIAEGSSLFIVLAILELLFIVLGSIAILFFYKDKIFILIQILYLIAVAISTKLNDYFMPIGYLCFLSIVLICVFLYRFENKK